MTYQDRAKRVKLLILDVDGVLTDGRIVYDNLGNELKFFNVQDGFGVHLLNRSGLKSVIITARKTKALKCRAKDMKIAKIYSTHKKLAIYNKVLRKFKLEDEDVCFMGDDVLDLAILKRAGFAISVPGGASDAKDAAHYITKKEGGKGAVREVVEIILKAQNLWDNVVKKEIS